MSIDTGAIARQRHDTALRNVDREVVRKTWSIGYADPGFTTRFGTPPEPSPHHTTTFIGTIVTDAGWIHRGACLACPWESPDRPRRDPAIEDAQHPADPGSSAEPKRLEDVVAPPDRHVPRGMGITD